MTKTTRFHHQEIKRLLDQLTSVHADFVITAIQAASKKLEEEKVTDEKLSEKYYKEVITARLKDFATETISAIAKINIAIGEPKIVRADATALTQLRKA